MIRLVAIICWLLSFESADGMFVPNDPIGVRLPNGFSIEKVAGDELASDIFCMATDPNGEVFVSGPGYIRRLVDANQDGVFESSSLFSNQPNSGAQGMWFDESSMLFSGDGGIWRCKDQDRNGVADGPPERLLLIKTGGEHLVHAIRKAHDGWFYVLSGNSTPILDEYWNGPFSPVKSPRAGFLMRLSPDFKTGEIVAHGFRNAYDFDFNREGQLFVYDSDGERDISLPWYRPTRVYQLQPGDDAGWMTPGWKRPSSYFDMPKEIGVFGRGSPTGVQCYRGGSFPTEFDDAIFVADWTFGRIHVFKRNVRTGEYDRGSDFAISDGQFGFAVTDLAVANDGSLLVSVGGRGTSGAVYRIKWNAAGVARTNEIPPTPIRLKAPFNDRAAWNQDSLAVVMDALNGDDAEASLVALECLVGRTSYILGSDLTTAENRDLLMRGIRKNLETFQPQRAKLVLRIASDWDHETIDEIPRTGLSSASSLILQLARLNCVRKLADGNPSDGEEEMTNLIAAVLENLPGSTERADDVCRIGQLAMAGAGLADVPEMMKGYTANWLPKSISDRPDRFADQLASLIDTLAPKNAESAREVGRLAAMLKANSPELQAKMVNQLAISESPIDTIHWLNCLAQMSTISSKHAAAIAQALAGIDKKIKDAGLQTDRNWNPRMQELSRQLFACDPEIAAGVSKSIAGREDQDFLFDALPAAYRVDASRKFFQAIQTDLEGSTPIQLRIATIADSPESKELLRLAARLPHLQEIAILMLALNPEPQDREFFREGLSLPDATVVSHCAKALMRFSQQPNSQELLAAFKDLKRLGWNKQDVALRDQLVRLMQHQTGKLFDYRFNEKDSDQTDSLKRWESYLSSSFPAEFKQQLADDQHFDLAQRLEKIDWTSGDATKGKLLYRDLKCSQCHDGGSRLGPRLDGVAKRFSREDLFKSIVVPSGQVPDRYRATVIETVDGRFFKGTVIYESVDGVTLQDVNGNTIRVNRADIESKTLSEKSLMPEGLLDHVGPQDWADLYAYIKEL